MLLHICTDYNAVKVYFELISRLQNDGIDNIVYVPSVIKKKSVQKDKKDETYKVIESPIYTQLDRCFFRRKEKKILGDIKQKIDFKKVDMMYAHTLFSAGYIANILKNTFGIKYAVAVRSTDINTFFKYRKTLKHIGIKILQEAEKIVFISETHRKYIFKKYIPNKYRHELESKSTVIFNGINNFWLDNENIGKKKTEKNSISLIQIGRLVRNKNNRTTIKVYKQLKKEGYDVELHIIGQGKEEKKLKQMAKNEEEIFFHGQLKKEDILQIMRKTDIFILPSKYETFGLVYAEALSQALPIIYTRNQGFDGIFEEGEVGYSVKYNSIKKLLKQ